LAISYRHVVDSHYVTVDIPMTFAAFLSIFLVVEDVAGRSRLREIPWAFVAAFAVLCKLPAVVLFLPYFVGAWIRGRFRGERGVLTWATFRPALIAAGIYLVLNPGFLVNLGFVLNLVGSTVGGVGDDVNPEYVGSELRENLWLFYSRCLLLSQGPGLLALSLVGAAFGLARRSRAAILHLCFVVPIFLLIAGSSSSHLYYFRYIVPMLPALCLLAGLAGDDLIRRVRWPRFVGSAATIVLALVLAVEPGGAVLRWDARSARMDTRTKAVKWVMENVPHQTSVLLEGFPEEMAQLSIPLPNLKRNVRTMIDTLQSTDPGKAKFWELKLETLEPPLYDLHTVRRSEPWGLLEDYVAEGVGFVVLRPEFFVRGTARTAKLDDEDVRTRFAFYDALVSSDGAERVAVFDASADGAPGFDIEIWQLPSGALQMSAAAASETASLGAGTPEGRTSDEPAGVEEEE
jgi:hypothetical protein